MSPITSQCARCGAALEFRIESAVVVVCEHCNTVNARTDRAFEDLGKVGDLVDSRSPLALWVEGRHAGVGFMITGRAQVRHGAGGLWDEWYVKLDDDRWGWLAEAQGRFYLTFALENTQVGPWQDAHPGGVARINHTPYVIAERGEAELVAAEGEIPYRLEPGERFHFADLQASGGGFATIDYRDDPPGVYIGHEVTLAQLGIDAAPQAGARREVSSAGMLCPQCGGALELRAPDAAERVACPYCDALLDVNQGDLVFLKALEGRRATPVIPLGRSGTIAGTTLTVIGFMVRSVTFVGVKYYWEEYLLYAPEVGFRWLTRSDGHWSYVEPVSVAEVEAGTSHYSGERATCAGREYRVFQDAIATVEYVSGEFYWKVSAGEQVTVCDYIAPPLMLSQEISAGEINYSRGRYLTGAEVGEAFGVEVAAPAPGTVAPHQPYRHGRVYPVGVALLALSLVALIVGALTRDGTHAFSNDVLVPPAEAADKPTVVFSEPFALKARQNLEIRIGAPVVNNWVYVQGDLFNEDTGLVQQFDVPIEYYEGVEAGERWTEGSQTGRRYLAALPAGNYSLRLQVERPHWTLPISLDVRVRQGVLRWRYYLLLLLGLSLIPIGVGVHHFGFEKRRWKDSDYAGMWGGGDDE